MFEPIRVVGLSGSLRQNSYNTALLRAAGEVMPEGMSLELFDLAAIPPYNEDVRSEGLPGPVKALREAIARADALIIATPEYNHSIPGMLKNAIDWASRPPEQPINGKPTAIMGVATGLFGTVRAQLHLRDILLALNASLVHKPQVLVGSAREKFDADGRLTDEATRGFLRQLMANLAVHVGQQRGARVQSAN